MTPTFRLFYGTFIHLPRSSLDGRQISLEVNKGGLWVSTDGRIVELDFDNVDVGVGELLKRKGWEKGSGASYSRQNGTGTGTETVDVFEARAEENEFFFPGFIGNIPRFTRILQGEGGRGAKIRIANGG